MSNGAINSQGSKIYHDTGNSPGAYQEIENVKTITGPSGTAALIDVSNLSSTRKEYLPGLADNGQLQLECQFIGGAASQQIDLLRMFNTNANPEFFMVKVPKDTTLTSFHLFTFQAIVTKWETSEAVDSAVKLNITLQTTGGVTYTPAP